MLDQIIEKWRTNPRLRAGAWLIAAIVLLNQALVLQDMQSELTDELQMKNVQLQRLETLGRDNDWFERSEEALQVMQTWRARLWTAETRGLAQAYIEEIVRESMTEVNAELPQVTISASQKVTGEPDLWEFTVNAQAKFSRNGLLNFLFKLESVDKAHLLRQITIERRSDATFYANINVVFFFSISTDQNA